MYEEAPAFQQNIFDYRKGRTRGAEMYDQLCKEIMRRILERQKDSQWLLTFYKINYFNFLLDILKDYSCGLDERKSG